MLMVMPQQGSSGPPSTPVPSMPAPVPASAGPLDAARLASDLAMQTLRAEARDATHRIDGAVAQRQHLIGQLDQAGRAQIAPLQAQIGQLDAVIAQLQANLANINDRMAQIQASNLPQIVVPPPTPNTSNFIRHGRDMAVVAVVSVVFICGVLAPIVYGLVRRLTRKSTAPQPVSDPVLNARMERLEHAVDAIAIEIERIAEGQRFVTKVLTQRPAQSPAAAKDSPAESAPFLALGAGPMEPIRAAERQSVRQSITPH